MSTKMQVQMLKDGNRTVIIINGAGKEEDELAYKIISSYYASMLNVPAAELGEAKKEPEVPDFYKTVEDLEPLPEPKIEAPTEEEIASMDSYSEARTRSPEIISDGDYKDMTPLEALQQDNESALTYLFKYASKMKDSPEKKEIVACCKQYMRDLPDYVSGFISRDRKCLFMENVAPMCDINMVVTGYSDIHTFVDYATDAEVDTALRNLAESFRERGLR